MSLVSQDTALHRLDPAAYVRDDDADAGFAEADGAGSGERALARLEQVADEARDHAAHAKAPNTLKAYRADWADFSAWCALHQLEFLPATPQTVALYLTNLARTHKVSTLYRRLSGISQAHQAAGFSTPTGDAQVRLVFQGIRRRLGSAPAQKNPAITAEVRAMVETLSSDTLGGSDPMAGARHNGHPSDQPPRDLHRVHALRCYSHRALLEVEGYSAAYEWVCSNALAPTLADLQGKAVGDPPKCGDERRSFLLMLAGRADGAPST